MAAKGERMSPELVARMREGRRQAMLAKKARGESRREPVMPPPDEFDLEDVSLPAAQETLIEHEEPPPPVQGDPSDPYNQWLLTLPSDAQEMFTATELRELYAEQQARATAEKKVRRKKEITDLALTTARANLGLLPEQKIEQMRVKQQNAKRVSMVVQLPPAQGNGLPSDVGLRIDGNVVENGKRHFCTYGEAASIREMIYRAQKHELTFKGENLRYQAYLMGQAMGTVNTTIDLTSTGDGWR